MAFKPFGKKYADGPVYSATKTYISGTGVCLYLLQENGLHDLKLLSAAISSMLRHILLTAFSLDRIQRLEMTEALLNRLIHVS